MNGLKPIPIESLRMYSSSKLYEYFWLEDNFFFWFGVNITANLYIGETNFLSIQPESSFCFVFFFQNHQHYFLLAPTAAASFAFFL